MNDMISAAFRDLAMALTDIAFERSDRADNNSHTQEIRREAMSQALLFNGFARALLKAASGMEARRAAAEHTDAVHDSPTPQGNAQ